MLRKFDGALNVEPIGMAIPGSMPDSLSGVESASIPNSQKGAGVAGSL
jgi:hypothetical protein